MAKEIYIDPEYFKMVGKAMLNALKVIWFTITLPFRIIRQFFQEELLWMFCIPFVMFSIPFFAVLLDDSEKSAEMKAEILLFVDRASSFLGEIIKTIQSNLWKNTMLL